MVIYPGLYTAKLEFFKHTLLEKKVLKLIIENSKITEIEPPAEGTAQETAKEQEETAKS